MATTPITTMTVFVTADEARHDTMAEAEKHRAQLERNLALQQLVRRHVLYAQTAEAIADFIDEHWTELRQIMDD